MHQKNVCFSIIVILKMLDFYLNQMFVINRNIAILNVERADFRCILWGISRDEVANRLSNSVLEDKGVLQMDFDANKTPFEVIGEGVFGRIF